MIGIGEFSHGTGLSIKTLRYYHDIGLLPAAHVDEFNGYRSYSATQLQDAAMLRLLRATGMPIAQMKQALTHPRELPDLLAERRKELDAQRELEDWALATAAKWRQTVNLDDVQTRDCEPVRWVGVEARIDLKELGEDPDEQEVEERFGVLQSSFEQLMVQLQESGVDVAPDGFWMSFTSDPRQQSVLRASYCVQVLSPLPASPHIDGCEVIGGELPARVEAFVTTEIPQEPNEEDLVAFRLPGGPLPHPTGLALSVVAEQAGIESTPVRQRALTSADGQVIEHSLTLRAL